jgi:hypothetical protein
LRSPCCGEFNGDCKADAAVVNTASHSASALLGNGVGKILSPLVNGSP